MDHSCTADSLRWKWPMVYDLINSLALHTLKCIKIMISRAASINDHADVV